MGSQAGAHFEREMNPKLPGLGNMHISQVSVSISLTLLGNGVLKNSVYEDGWTDRRTAKTLITIKNLILRKWEGSSEYHVHPERILPAPTDFKVSQVETFSPSLFT